MKNAFKLTFILALMLSMVSCKKEDDGPTDDGGGVSAQSVFNILGTIDDAYYLAQSSTLTDDSLTFVNNGTQLEADQAARIIASGDYLYSLNYGTGVLSQIQPNDADGYDVIKEINAGLSVGTNRPRFALADDNTIMVYNVAVEAVTEATDSGDVVVDQVCTLRLASVSIPSLAIASLNEFVIPQTTNAALGATIGYHPMRVDAPVISGDKIYFGLMHMDMFDPTLSPPSRDPKQTGLESLVFDYPSLSNGVVVESDKGAGHTTGYRAPSMHVDENGDVYQSNWYINGPFDLSGGDKTVITRLNDGAYDDSYVFNVSEALGLETNIGTVGWFYAGNGIGFMPLHLESAGDYWAGNAWSVARIDLYSKTAVLLDVAYSPLFSYENGIVVDGKFYMAISPVDGDAYIYEFDPNSTGSTETDGAFTKGLKLDGENLLVEGIF